METGTFKIVKDDMMIPELINEVYDIFSTQCRQRNIELIIDIQTCLFQITFNSDKNRIKQVLLNLLSNSTKFTFKGEIKISAKVVVIDKQHFVEF